MRAHMVAKHVNIEYVAELEYANISCISIYMEVQIVILITKNDTIKKAMINKLKRITVN